MSSVDGNEKRRVVSLDEVCADGWLEELGEGADNFADLCRLVGSKFVAFAVLAGVRITAITVDRNAADATLIDFRVGDEGTEHRLSLVEFRRRLTSTMLSSEEHSKTLPDEPQPEDIQSFVGLRYLLLSPLMGFKVLELHLGGGEEPTITIEHADERVDLKLEDFREMIRDAIRDEAQRSQSEDPFSIDLTALVAADKAAAEGKWPHVIELLGSWPGPLSVLLRAPEGRELTPDVKVSLARALGMLGTAYVHTRRFDWADEVMRLAIQWGQDQDGGGDLFRRLAESCLRRERYGQAIGLLRRALSLGAHPRDVMPPLAQCYAARGRHVAAACCVEQALAAGAEAASIASVQAQSGEALGAAWTQFRSMVPEIEASETESGTSSSVDGDG